MEIFKSLCNLQEIVVRLYLKSGTFSAVVATSPFVLFLMGSHPGQTDRQKYQSNLLDFSSDGPIILPHQDTFSQAFLEVAVFERSPLHTFYGISMHPQWKVRCLSNETEKMPVKFGDGVMRVNYCLTKHLPGTVMTRGVGDKLKAL